MATINETIANAIVAEIESNNGTYSIEVEIDANTVAEVTGSYEIDGYTEDNYFNGTGAFVVTSVSVVVEALEVFTYDEDGNETASTISPDIAEIERYAERELAA